MVRPMSPDSVLDSVRAVADVIEFPHPTATYHHGGMLAFSPTDGHLYVGVGDGALAPCDPGGNGQDLASLYGKMLRLNVETLPYSTTGNPFDGITHGKTGGIGVGDMGCRANTVVDGDQEVRFWNATHESPNINDLQPWIA